MKSLLTIVPLAVLFAGVCFDYGETRSNAKRAVAVAEDEGKQLAKLREDVIVLRSHLQSWSDEARRTR